MIYWVSQSGHWYNDSNALNFKEKLYILYNQFEAHYTIYMYI